MVGKLHLHKAVLKTQESLRKPYHKGIHVFTARFLDVVRERTHLPGVSGY